MWVLRTELWDVRSGIWELRYEMCYYNIWDLKYEIWYRRFEMWDLRFKMFDARSENACACSSASEVPLLNLNRSWSVDFSTDRLSIQSDLRTEMTCNGYSCAIIQESIRQSIGILNFNVGVFNVVRLVLRRRVFSSATVGRTRQWRSALVRLET